MLACGHIMFIVLHSQWMVYLIGILSDLKDSDTQFIRSWQVVVGGLYFLGIMRSWCILLTWTCKEDTVVLGRIFQLNLLLLSRFLQITVMDEMWTVFRRYSRFREMHKSLKLKYPEVRVSPIVTSFQRAGWLVVWQVAPGHGWTKWKEKWGWRGHCQQFQKCGFGSSHWTDQAPGTSSRSSFRSFKAKETLQGWHGSPGSNNNISASSRCLNWMSWALCVTGFICFIFLYWPWFVFCGTF